MHNLFRMGFYICLLSIEFLATTTREIEVIQNTWDKANHFIAFFTLYILLSLAYKNFSTKLKILFLLAFVYMSSYL
ncbi:MAG: hypothetical protein GXO30_06345, partial [Epsilonproteobacteria bacterium]|nr:hypothetical protein [Campylobacterota bacterium]